MAELLKQTWWSLALRGVVALVLGLLIFLWPGVTIELLLWFFGIYCLVDGAWLVIGVLTKRQADRTWGVVMLEGLTTMLLGIATLLVPGPTGFLLIYYVAVRVLLMGAFNIYMGIRLMKVGASGWWPLFTGIVTAIFSLFIFLNPESIVLFLGLFALFAGIVLIVLAIQVLSWGKDDEPTQDPTTA